MFTELIKNKKILKWKNKDRPGDPCFNVGIRLKILPSNQKRFSQEILYWLAILEILIFKI